MGPITYKIINKIQEINEANFYRKLMRYLLYVSLISMSSPLNGLSLSELTSCNKLKEQGARDIVLENPYVKMID